MKPLHFEVIAYYNGMLINRRGKGLFFFFILLDVLIMHPEIEGKILTK